MEELFINGQKVDIDDETFITLKYNSNFWGDITKIVQNHSYTISVPKSVNNTQILAMADMPSMATENRAARRYNDARYYRNGVEVLVGKAVLLESTEESFNLFLAWGELAELRAFLDKSGNLNEEFDQSLAGLWNDFSINTTSDEGFYRYYRGIEGVGTFNVHPCVRFSKIIQLIQEKSGLYFVFSPEMNERLRTTVLLCNTKNDTGANTQAHPLNANTSDLLINDDAGENSFGCFYFKTTTEICNFFEIRSINTRVGIITARKDIEKISISLNIFRQIARDTMNFFIKQANGNVIFSGAMVNQNGVWQLTGDFEIGVNLSAGDQLFFYIEGKDNGYPQVYHLTPGDGSTVTINQYIDNENMYDDFGEVPYPGWFPIYANLPAISTVEFIKSIGWMFGLYATRRLNDATHIVRFEPIDILYANQTKAVNWTHKMVDHQRLTPSSLKYRRDGLAMSNKLKYKDDIVKSEATITVDDETLQYTADLITLPYAASKTLPAGVGASRRASIPQYSIVDGKIEFTVVEPRVLNQNTQLSGSYDLNFDTLDFPALATKYYAGYQKMMKRPIVMTENFDLTEFDLRDLDFTVPVYLEQYGQFYAIISIQDQKGRCVVELLQL